MRDPPTHNRPFADKSDKVGMDCFSCRNRGIYQSKYKELLDARLICTFTSKI